MPTYETTRRLSSAEMSPVSVPTGSLAPNIHVREFLACQGQACFSLAVCLKRGQSSGSSFSSRGSIGIATGHACRNNFTSTIAAERWTHRPEPKGTHLQTRSLTCEQHLHFPFSVAGSYNISFALTRSKEATDRAMTDKTPWLGWLICARQPRDPVAFS